MEYNSDRMFQLWASTVTHQTVLLRSNKRLTKWGKPISDDPEDNYTIDIEFMGVEYMEIPTLFKGISIKVVDNKDTQPIPSVEESVKTFQILTGRKEYQILAISAGVGKSDWDYQKNRLDNFSLKYDEIIRRW